MNQDDTLGQYQIIRKIGSGGMGEVYRARDSVLDRDVALKVLPAEWREDPERLARFQREAKVLASLHHPNIASIFGLEEVQGQTILIMELVEGDDLAEILEHGPLPVERALDIATQITVGLEEAHAKGFIHRDLKPANIKCTPEGKVKILDFGLARALESDPSKPDSMENSPTITAAMTAQGVILGTAAYMSPEQARGQTIDERSDIWAFGCILLEMITGRSFFAGDTFSDTLASILKSEPKWEELPGDLPPSILRLLRRCLAKDPQNRLHSIADARLDLLDISAQPEPSLSIRTESRASSPSLGWKIGAAVGWLALAGLALLFFTNQPESNLPTRIDSLTFGAREWGPDVSASGDMAVFTSDRDGMSRIWLKQLTGGGEVPLTSGPDDGARFSPDGSQILFTRDVEGGRQIYRQSLVGGQPRKIIEDALEADWSPDGSQVAFLRAKPDQVNNSVQVGMTDLQSGEETTLATIENRACYGIRWSPDGANIAVNVASLTGNVAETSGISLVDVATGDIRYLNPTSWTGPLSVLEWLPDGRSFIVGQANEVIAHVAGTPSLIFQHHLDGPNNTPLFWQPLRLPKGSWGSSTLAVLPGGDVILDQQVEFTNLLEYQVLDQGLSEPKALSTGQSIDRQPVYSPDGTQMMFSSNRSGNVDLWLKNLATGQESRFTDDPGGDWDPAFSADGQLILWSSDRSGNMEIWIAAADGSGARQVSNDGVDAENPTMTRDGQWIVFTSSNDARRGIWKIRPDGSDAEQLAQGSFLLPEVSPDGRYALFMEIRKLDHYVRVVEVETGRRLDYVVELHVNQYDENVIYGRARWTPDGNSIIYTGQDEDGHSGIYMSGFTPDSPWDGSQRKVAGFDHWFTTESLGISPDGKRITIAALHELRTLKRASNVPDLTQ